MVADKKNGEYSTKKEEEGLNKMERKANISSSVIVTPTYSKTFDFHERKHNCWWTEIGKSILKGNGMPEQKKNAN